MNHQIVDLKDHPELIRVIRAVDPKYRKHKAIVHVAAKVALSGTYWDGGSRSSYAAVNLTTLAVGSAGGYAPPQFGGPRTDPEVDLPEGAVIVRTGTFCGKQAAATVFINPANVAKLLPGA